MPAKNHGCAGLLFCENMHRLRKIKYETSEGERFCAYLCGAPMENRGIELRKHLLRQVSGQNQLK